MSVEGNVDLSRVRKKLEEAGFFLGKMSEQEQRLTGHRVPFDYYLSAFLSAGRTVDYRLCHEHKAIYKPWRKAWNARITPDENRLMSARITSSLLAPRTIARPCLGARQDGYAAATAIWAKPA